jgi:hypothetical protein
MSRIEYRVDLYAFFMASPDERIKIIPGKAIFVGCCIIAKKVIYSDIMVNGEQTVHLYDGSGFI